MQKTQVHIFRTVRYCAYGLMVLLFVSCAGSFSRVKGEEFKRYPPPPAIPGLQDNAIELLLHELSDPSYEVRERATAELKNSGFAGLEKIAELFNHAEYETRLRAFSVILHLHTKAMEYQFDQHVDRLEVLFESAINSDDEQLAGLALQSVERYSAVNWEELYLYDVENVWEQYAIQRVKRAGIRVVNQTVMGSTRFDPQTDTGGYDFIISKKWNRNDNSLRYLYRIPSLHKVYVLSGAGVSEKQIDSMVTNLPPDCVQTRSAAKLGVMGGGTFGRSSCVIKDVTPGSAADRAGIRVHDVIMGYEGKEIEHFEQLIQEIKSHQPGDKVKMQILRGNKVYDLSVTLDGWIP